MSEYNNLINWLLQGDPSIRWQVQWDLLNASPAKETKKDGRWLVNSGMSGRKYFDLEVAGQPSRWNTLRALRVLNWWNALE